NSPQGLAGFLSSLPGAPAARPPPPPAPHGDAETHPNPQPHRPPPRDPGPPPHSQPTGDRGAPDLPRRRARAPAEGTRPETELPRSDRTDHRGAPRGGPRRQVGRRRDRAR